MPHSIGTIIKDVLTRPFSRDLFAMKPKPIVQQKKATDPEGQGTVIPPSSSVVLAEVSLVPGDYLVMARFNIEVKTFAPGLVDAHARTQLRVGPYENDWNNIDFVLNYGVRSLVAAHMLGVKLTEDATTRIMVLSDPGGGELLANHIVLACIPVEGLQLVEV